MSRWWWPVLGRFAVVVVPVMAVFGALFFLTVEWGAATFGTWTWVTAVAVAGTAGGFLAGRLARAWIWGLR